MMAAGSGSPADLRAAFNQYDLDGDGNITEAEMNRYLSSVMQQYARHDTIDNAQVERRAREAAAKMFREADANGDGRISFDEFCRWHSTYVAPASVTSAGGGNIAGAPLPPAAPPTYADTSVAGAQVSMASMMVGASAGHTTAEWAINITGATYCHVTTDSAGAQVAHALNTMDTSIAAGYKNRFVAYVLGVNAHGKQWTVLRRFSSIDSFWRELLRRGIVAKAPMGSFGRLSKGRRPIPAGMPMPQRMQVPFPPKTFLGRVDVQQRQAALNAFFAELARVYPTLASNDLFTTFANGGDVGALPAPTGRASARASLPGTAAPLLAGSGGGMGTGIGAGGGAGTGANALAHGDRQRQRDAAAAAGLRSERIQCGRLLRVRLVVPPTMISRMGPVEVAQAVAFEGMGQLNDAVESAAALAGAHASAAALIELMSATVEPVSNTSAAGAAIRPGAGAWSLAAHNSIPANPTAPAVATSVAGLDCEQLLTELLGIFAVPVPSGGLGENGRPLVPPDPLLMRVAKAFRASDRGGIGTLSPLEVGAVVARSLQLDMRLQQQLQHIVTQASVSDSASTGMDSGTAAYAPVDYHRFVGLIDQAASQMMLGRAGIVPPPLKLAPGFTSHGGYDVFDVPELSSAPLSKPMGAGALDPTAVLVELIARLPTSVATRDAKGKVAVGAATAGVTPDVVGGTLTDIQWQSFRTQLVTGLTLVKHEGKKRKGGAVVTSDRILRASGKQLDKLTWRKQGVKGAVGQIGSFDLGGVTHVATADVAEWAHRGGEFPFMPHFSWDEAKRRNYFVLLSGDPAVHLRHDTSQPAATHLALEAPSPEERDRVVAGFRHLLALRAADPTKLGARTEDELDVVFSVFDANGDGAISALELGQALNDMGHPQQTEAELNAVIAKVKAERGTSTGSAQQTLTLEDFKHMMRNRDERQEMVAAFKLFDLNGDGFVTAFELGQALVQMGETHITQQDAARMIAQVDKNADGKLSYEEFVEMMLSRKTS